MSIALISRHGALIAQRSTMLGHVVIAANVGIQKWHMLVITYIKVCECYRNLISNMKGG